jgi:hypothetical protein
MGFSGDNFYAGWRESCRTLELRDGDCAPPEKLLQTIWLHQRIHRDQLRTTDGQPLRVMHPGFPSAEGGPDFRGAVLKFGGEPPVSGDVEIDLQSSGWHAHGHDTNSNFKSVILHVIWDEVQGPRSKVKNLPPTLRLQNILDAPLSELALAMENEPGLPKSLRGKCSALLRELSETQVRELLHSAAKVRFVNKANALLARAKRSGWELTLWENLFRALGYKHNAWPMQNLAETKTHWFDGMVVAPRRPRSASGNPSHADLVFEVQARLLGVSGLLPDQMTRSQMSADAFLRRAWDCWWRDRDKFSDSVLPRAVWKFHGLRPANHPQRRLALASHWLTTENFVGRIEEWIATKFPNPTMAATCCQAGRRDSLVGQKLVDSLFEILQVKHDDFWSWHWTFKSPRLARPQPLLGRARMTDLAVNVVLPWLWVRSACAQAPGGNEKLLREVERRYFAWPAAEDNSILKLSRQRLFGSLSDRMLKSAAQQQGLMQIVRDFCEHSNAVCTDCHFPDQVQGWRRQQLSSSLDLKITG